MKYSTIVFNKYDFILLGMKERDNALKERSGEGLLSALEHFDEALSYAETEQEYDIASRLIHEAQDVYLRWDRVPPSD